MAAVDSMLRTRDVWELFGSRESSAHTAMNRAASTAGFGNPGSGNWREFTRDQIAGLLAVVDLGTGSKGYAPTAPSAAVYEMVAAHSDGFVVMRASAVPGSRVYLDPEWVQELGSHIAGWNGAPMVVSSCARYHRLVAEHLDGS